MTTTNRVLPDAANTGSSERCWRSAFPIRTFTKLDEQPALRRLELRSRGTRRRRQPLFGPNPEKHYGPVLAKTRKVLTFALQANRHATRRSALSYGVVHGIVPRRKSVAESLHSLGALPLCSVASGGTSVPVRFVGPRFFPFASRGRGLPYPGVVVLLRSPFPGGSTPHSPAGGHRPSSGQDSEVTRLTTRSSERRGGVGPF